MVRSRVCFFFFFCLFFFKKNFWFCLSGWKIVPRRMYREFCVVVAIFFFSGGFYRESFGQLLCIFNDSGEIFSVQTKFILSVGKIFLT